MRADDAYVLSLVDGECSAEDIAQISGMALGGAVKILDRLEELGAITIGGAPKVGSGRPVARATRRDVPGARATQANRGGRVVPTLKRGRDLGELALGARDGFVLGQIDGKTSVEEIAEISGLSTSVLDALLDRFAELGVIEFADSDGRSATQPGQHLNERARPPREERRASKRMECVESAKAPEPGRHSTAVAQRRATQPPPMVRGGSGRTARGNSVRGPSSLRAGSQRAPSMRPNSVRTNPARPPVSKRAPSSSRPPQREPERKPDRKPEPPVDETCDLDPALQARIAAKLADTQGADHYAVLEIERDADRKAIKRAYYTLAATFHSDRYFGKKLGPLRRVLQDVFVRVTAAHDTLSDTRTRGAYDARLPPLKSAPSRAAATAETRASKPDATAIVLAAPSVPPSSRRGSGKPVASQSRRMKAAKIIGGSHVIKSVPPPRASSPSGARRAVEGALKRSFEHHVENAGRHKAKVFVEAAERAAAQDDPVGAMNLYRLALQCSGTPEIRAALEATELEAQPRIFDVALKRARAAEGAAQWRAAAEHYGKAYGVRPDAALAERLANALRHEGTDLRRAAKVAEEAVLKEPTNVVYRLTLAEVYFDADLYVRAKGEASRALDMAPSDARAKELVARIGKVASKARKG